MEGPRCSDLSWAKVHKRPAGRVGINPVRPVPAHSSDAWLAGMVRAKAGKGIYMISLLGICVVILMYERPKGTALTLHAALCRAVAPNITHTC